MGFVTTINPRNGREVFACEFGKPGCTRTGCKARKCPYSYCQRYYACKSCWNQVKSTWKADHASCKNSMDMRRIEDDQFLIGGIKLDVYHNQVDGSDRCYLVETERWFEASCRYFHTAWLTIAEVRKLESLGHVVTVTNVRNQL